MVVLNKLVRDKVPDLVRAKGGTDLKIWNVAGSELDVELRMKLVQVAHKLQVANTRKKIVDELGDVLDLVDEIVNHNRIDPTLISQSRAEKKNEAGGFGAGTILVCWEPAPSNTPPSENNRLAYLEKGIEAYLKGEVRIGHEEYFRALFTTAKTL